MGSPVHVAKVVLTMVVHVAAQDAPKFCTFEGQDCEPANTWECKQPVDVTPASCMDACDSCEYCIGVVVHQGQCIFKGCNTECGVFMQGTCGEETPSKAVDAPDHNLYSKNLDPHFCRSYAYEEGEKEDQFLHPHEYQKEPKFCAYDGQDCEPANTWECKQPIDATPGTCMDACDSCEYCIGVVVHQGQCIFKGCNSDCGVYTQGACSEEGPHQAVNASDHNLYSKILDPHFCRSYAYEQGEEEDQFLQPHEDKKVPKFCSYDGQDCEPAQTWECKQPLDATPANCMDACDSCEYCIGVVVHQGQCIFKGCNVGSDCGVYTQKTCSDEGPPKAVDAPDHNLYSKNLDPHSCRSYAYEQGEKQDQFLQSHEGQTVPNFCAYEGQDCEPAKSWECKQPMDVTPANCMDACDSCEYCIGVVVHEDQCIFKGCNSECGVYTQGACGDEGPSEAVDAPEHSLYAKTLDPHFCRSYAFEQQAAAAQPSGAIQQKWLFQGRGSLSAAVRTGPATLAVLGIGSVILLALVAAVLTRRGVERRDPFPEEGSLLEMMDGALSEGLVE